MWNFANRSIKVRLINVNTRQSTVDTVDSQWNEYFSIFIKSKVRSNYYHSPNSMVIYYYFVEITKHWIYASLSFPYYSSQNWLRTIAQVTILTNKSTLNKVKGHDVAWKKNRELYRTSFNFPFLFSSNCISLSFSCFKNFMKSTVFATD